MELQEEPRTELQDAIAAEARDAGLRDARPQKLTETLGSEALGPGSRFARCSATRSSAGSTVSRRRATKCSVASSAAILSGT